MGVPNVGFVESESSLGGSSPTNDGIGGLILSHEATAQLALNTPQAIYNVKGAEALLITGFALNEIKDFYTKAPDGQELWIMIVSADSLLADICDKNNDIAKKLLQGSNGRVKFWGVNIEKPGTYVADQTEGIDKDVYDAMLKANELCVTMADTKFIPTRCILPGREWDGDIAKLKDLKTATQNKVQITLHGSEGSKEAKVGFLLGLYSSIPVQRNPGRVESGDLGLADKTVFYTDGVTAPESFSDYQDTVHDKGYIFPIKRVEYSGYFYNDDPTATSNEDDYASFANGRVMDKVRRLSYGVYSGFINGDYEKAPDGSISIGELKRLQGKIDDKVQADMKSAKEVSGFKSYVYPLQEVVGQTKIQLRTQPRGYHKDILIEVGFTNTIE